MFDIGFSELLVIGVVALIVIGPERLPGVARTLGHLFGRMQRYVNDVKADIQREVELDELKKLRESVEESAREIEQSVNREFDTAGREMRELQSLVDSAAQRASEPTAARTQSSATPIEDTVAADGALPAPETAPPTVAPPETGPHAITSPDIPPATITSPETAPPAAAANDTASPAAAPNATKLAEVARGAGVAVEAPKST